MTDKSDERASQSFDGWIDALPDIDQRAFQSRRSYMAGYAAAVLATAPAEPPTEILNAICQDLLIMAEHRESLETRGVIADCVRRAWDAGHIAGSLQAPAEPQNMTQLTWGAQRVAGTICKPNDVNRELAEMIAAVRAIKYHTAIGQYLYDASERTRPILTGEIADMLERLSSEPEPMKEPEPTNELCWDCPARNNDAGTQGSPGASDRMPNSQPSLPASPNAAPAEPPKERRLWLENPEPPKDGEVAALIEKAHLYWNDSVQSTHYENCESYHPRCMIAKLADALARLCAPVPELTERERGVLRHALTGGRDVTPYRNHFAASEGHADMPTLRALVARGLMTERKSGVTPDTLFHCTEAGAKAVGLHLPNDEPAAPVPAREWMIERLTAELMAWFSAGEYPLTERRAKIIAADLLNHILPPPAADK